jgi:hypothetical protein
LTRRISRYAAQISGSGCAHHKMTDNRFDEIARVLILAGATATVTAAWVGFIAHFDLGISRQEIRTPALLGAAIIALLLAVEYFGQKLGRPK